MTVKIMAEHLLKFVSFKGGFVVGILTFISIINTTSERHTATSLNVGFVVFMSS